MISFYSKGELVGLFGVAGCTKLYLGVHVKCLVFCPILSKFGVSGQHFVKVPSIKCHGNPSSGSSANTCEQVDGHA
jgi:hypothetical protein